MTYDRGQDRYMERIRRCWKNLRSRVSNIFGYYYDEGLLRLQQEWDGHAAFSLVFFLSIPFSLKSQPLSETACILRKSHH